MLLHAVIRNLQSLRNSVLGEPELEPVEQPPDLEWLETLPGQRQTGEQPDALPALHPPHSPAA